MILAKSASPISPGMTLKNPFRICPKTALSRPPIRWTIAGETVDVRAERYQGEQGRSTAWLSQVKLVAPLMTVESA